MQGFKHDTKASSSAAYDSSGKRSYKSLQDSKNHSAYSGKTLGADQQRSKGSSSDKHDPYRISSIVDAVDESDTVELRPVDTRSDAALMHDPPFSRTDLK
jgi:hypothetical protein